MATSLQIKNNTSVVNALKVQSRSKGTTEQICVLKRDDDTVLWEQHDKYWKIIRDHTTPSDLGYQERRCSRCNELFATDVVGHSWSITNTATLGQKGVKSRTCDKCKTTKTENDYGGVRIEITQHPDSKYTFAEFSNNSGIRWGDDYKILYLNSLNKEESGLIGRKSNEGNSIDFIYTSLTASSPPSLQSHEGLYITVYDYGWIDNKVGYAFGYAIRYCQDPQIGKVYTFEFS